MYKCFCDKCGGATEHQTRVSISVNKPFGAQPVSKDLCPVCVKELGINSIKWEFQQNPSDTDQFFTLLKELLNDA